MKSTAEKFSFKQLLARWPRDNHCRARKPGLLFVAAHVFASGRLGLKGGTALNLFVHDIPRLSVDINAVFLDHTLSREAAIGDELVRIKSELEALRLTVAIPAKQDGEDVKLVVSNAAAQIKVGQSVLRESEPLNLMRTMERRLPGLSRANLVVEPTKNVDQCRSLGRLAAIAK